MGTERIALNQQERDRLRMMHEIRRKQITQDRSCQAAEHQRIGTSVICWSNRLGLDFELRQLLRQVATLDDSGISFYDLELSLAIVTGEVNLEYMLANAEVAHRQVWQPCWQRWIEI
jgi:hypothetical protein